MQSAAVFLVLALAANTGKEYYYYLLIDIISISLNDRVNFKFCLHNSGSNLKCS